MNFQDGDRLKCPNCGGAFFAVSSKYYKDITMADASTSGPAFIVTGIVKCIDCKQELDSSQYLKEGIDNERQ